MSRTARTWPVVVVAFLSFVSLGLPDAVAGVAWPSIRHSFGLSIDRLGELLACGVAGYLTSSILAARMTTRWGVGPLLACSTGLVALAMMGYAMSPGWLWMLPMAFASGLGSGAIDTAMNAFAAAKFSPRITTWLHACYGIGATLGPLIMTACLNSPSLNWRWGYGCLALALAIMAAVFAFTPQLWSTSPSDPQNRSSVESLPGVLKTLRRPIVLAHMLLFFVYAGIEVTAGQWTYSLLTESRQVSKPVAGLIVGLFWASLTAGRIAFGQWSARLSPLRILRIAMILAPLGAACLAIKGNAITGGVGAAILGFGLAPIYPMLIAVTPARVGERFAMQTIGFEVSAATIGIAALPSAAGVLASAMGLEVIGIFLICATVALLATHELTVRTGQESAGVQSDAPTALRT